MSLRVCILSSIVIVSMLSTIANANYTSNWTVSTSNLTTFDSQMMIGYYDTSIFLFGGQQDPYQSIEYNYKTCNVINRGHPSPMQAYGNSQYYTQLNNKMYWIDEHSCGGSCIDIYDFTNKTYIYLAIQIPYHNGYHSVSDGCIASNDNILFVVGGIDYLSNRLNTLQIYNLSNASWSLGPNMQSIRWNHSCIVDPKRRELYAIGGDGDMEYNSIEKINITDISSSSWKYIQDLIYSSMNTRAVIHQDYIFVIGGRYYENYVKQIQIIDCVLGNVSLGGYLGYSVINTAPILVNGTMYAFGGLNEKGSLNTWQYVEISTNDSISCPISNESIWNMPVWMVVLIVLLLCITLIVTFMITGKIKKGLAQNKTKTLNVNITSEEQQYDSLAFDSERL